MNCLLCNRECHNHFKAELYSGIADACDTQSQPFNFLIELSL